MSDFVFPCLAFSFLHISQLENKVNIISRLRQFWDMHLLWMKVYAHTQHSNGFLCVVLNLDATWGKRGNFLFSLAGKKLEILSLSLEPFFRWILHAPQYHILTKTKNSNSHLHFLSLQKLDFLSEQQLPTTTFERTIKVLESFCQKFSFLRFFFFLLSEPLSWLKVNEEAPTNLMHDIGNQQSREKDEGGIFSGHKGSLWPDPYFIVLRFQRLKVWVIKVISF